MREIRYDWFDLGGDVLNLVRTCIIQQRWRPSPGSFYIFFYKRRRERCTGPSRFTSHHKNGAGALDMEKEKRLRKKNSNEIHSPAR